MGRSRSSAGIAVVALLLLLAPLSGAAGADNVVWTSPVGVTVTGNSIQKTGGCDGCPAGAVSQQTIASGDGYMEFTAQETTTLRAAGLGNGNVDADLPDVEFAIELNPVGGSSYAYVRERGVYKAETAHAAGDVFRVAVEGGQVKYRRNGLLFYTSAVAPAYPLLVDTSLSNLGATIANAVIVGGVSPPPSPPPPDTVPPVRANGAPSGTLPSGTTQATLSLTTDEAATCRYATTPGVAYGSMTNTFATTGGSSHATTVSGLTDGGAYTYYVRCRDFVGNANADDFTVSFAVASNQDLPPGFEETVWASGLGAVAAMDFAPDGRLFVCEQGGALRIVKGGVLLPTPFVTIPVDSFGEQGLLGVAFDPSFSANRYLYVYYTAPAGQNRVSRFTASASNPDVVAAASELVILDNILTSGGYHNGGSLHFGLDGKLYVGVGDGGDPSRPQLLGALAGKLLRLDPSAFPNIVPPDNPFVSVPGARGEIWALGLRNPFTFAVEPGTGKIQINDVGLNTWEEINVAQRGANYGWPTCEGVCGNPNFVDPIYAYSHNGGSAAITGGTFYRAVQFPAEYAGSYFFSDYVNGFIRRLKPDNQALEFAPTAKSPVDLKVGPDGSLYYLSLYETTVYRIRYVSVGNRTPVAVASAVPTSGPPPLAVSFSGSGSTDPDGDPLRYVWNFGDGSPTQEGLAVVHTYLSEGPFNAVLTVDDGRGGSATAAVAIVVGQPPVGVITRPLAGATYNAGDTIFFEGTATDAQDGVLPASAFSWTILFHHLVHTHPFIGPLNGVTSGSFTIPKTGETDDRVWYRIYLTVKDSSGLTSTSTRDVLPNKSTFTLATVPSGLQLTLDGQPLVSPQSVLGVVGIIRTLGAPSSQSLGGRRYDFVSWSDGGAATHTIDTPAANTTYTATYREVSGVSTVNVVWTSAVNVTITGNSIQKTAGCNGCTGGAVSQQAIVSGDGYMEFTTQETNTLRAAGLGNGDTNTSVSDVEWAIQLNPVGTSAYAYVRERGVYKSETPCVAGDVFRVAVEGGQVKYRKNGVLFYTSAAAPTYPLLVDTSLASTGATIANARISGLLTGP